MLQRLPIVLLLLLLPSLIALSQPEAAISYQGYVEQDGVPLEGRHAVIIRLYDAPTGGTLVWSSVSLGPTFTAGVFDVVLTGGTPDLSNVAFDRSLWIEPSIGRTILPRSALTMVPVAQSLRNVRVVPTAVDGLPNIIGGIAINGTHGGVVGAFIGGGGTRSQASNYPNLVSGNFGSVVGGTYNSAGYYAAVGGGQNNRATGDHAAIAGGRSNTAAGAQSFIGGGFSNETSAADVVVTGGHQNEATGTYATIGGGRGNRAWAVGATIAGGGVDDTGDPLAHNEVTGSWGSIGGGTGNRVTGSWGAVAGGYRNAASSTSFVGGGSSNEVSVGNSVIGGGTQNLIEGLGGENVIGGGISNLVTARYGTIAGGISNTASGSGSAIGGGTNNKTQGSYASVPGGGYNAARQLYAMAAGHHARANHIGSFVWNGRASVAVQDTAYTTADHQFLVYSDGGIGLNTNATAGTLSMAPTGNSGIWLNLQTSTGASKWFANLRDGGFNIGESLLATTRFHIEPGGQVGIGTDNPDFLLHVNGSAGKPGGGSWSVASDARLKRVESSFDRGLDALTQLSPVRYHYLEDNVLGMPSDQSYVGFVAQEVQAAVPEAVATDERGYLHVTNDPILWTMLNAIKELAAENESLRRRVEALEGR